MVPGTGLAVVADVGVPADGEGPIDGSCGCCPPADGATGC